MASEKVMRSAVIFALMTMLILLETNCFAVFSTASGYASTELYSSYGTYTTMGGLDLDGGKLYFGHYTAIKAIELTDKSVATVGTIVDNIDNVIVLRHEGLTYTAFGTSLDSPYPYKMGYIDENGTYVNQLDEDGIYDATVNSQGDCFIVANPDALGTKIFTYDWNTGATILVADIGGYSGGLTFDGAGNLYYADQGIFLERDPAILKFTPSQLAAGGLDATDAEVVLDIQARYMAFDQSGNFYVTTGYGATLSQYDIDAQSLVDEIAYGSIGKFLLDGDYLYAVDTDWDDYYSTIQQITIPEPMTLILLSLAGLWLRRRRA
jgi:hypothetical protein